MHGAASTRRSTSLSRCGPTCSTGTCARPTAHPYIGGTNCRSTSSCGSPRSTATDRSSRPPSRQASAPVQGRCSTGWRTAKSTCGSAWMPRCFSASNRCSRRSRSGPRELTAPTAAWRRRGRRSTGTWNIDSTRSRPRFERRVRPTRPRAGGRQWRRRKCSGSSSTRRRCSSNTSSGRSGAICGSYRAAASRITPFRHEARSSRSLARSTSC